MSDHSPPIIYNEVRRSFYLDSVALMRVSADISARDGVLEAALMIGSESNRGILEAANLLLEDGRQAGPNDLIIALRATTEQEAVAAIEAAQSALDTRARGSGSATEADVGPREIDTALEQLPAANLALISVPGEFAAREARLALRQGLNVMLFSDNVSLGQELELKQFAREQGLIVMGPDCGTAHIGGTPLAFANVVAAGNVGVIAASGTGLQEFSVLLSRAGGGVSNALGVGGRDLSDSIGGISSLTALQWLEEDPATEIIVVLSKPPGPRTRQQFETRLRECKKRVIVCFLGINEEEDSLLPLLSASTLRSAVELVTGKTIGAHVAADFATDPNSPRHLLRGLFTGGTLCAEAQVVMRAGSVEVTSNAPIPGVSSAIDNGGHVLLDLGADEYTAGRPHPMIEPSVRAQPLQAALADPTVAVVLLDVVLGYGAHSDPAASVVDAVNNAGDARPIVVASVCGTDQDPQNYSAQVQKLQDAGVIVAPSNAHATELALNVLAQR